jgi:hypothetical protein
MGRLNTNPSNANPKHVGIGTLANAAAEKVEAGAKCPWLFAEDNALITPFFEIVHFRTEATSIPGVY